MNNPNVQEILQRHGLATAKSLGQNFLRDGAVLEAIAAAAAPATRILEIGAGVGSLTGLLCRRAEQVITVEIDRKLEPLLREEVPFENHRFIWSDILKYDFSAPEAPFTVVGNLPYYITTEILMLLLKQLPRWDSAVLMVQREVAERLLCGPGSKEYRAASAIVQGLCDGELLFEVPPHCFFPPPHVHSAVLRLTPKKDFPNPESYIRFINTCFAARRKQLCSSAALQQLLKTDKNGLITLLEEAGFPPDIRAERFTSEDFLRIYKLCTKN